jgi:hypothetical protein
MITLPPLDETQKLKLTELHRLTVDIHAAVLRLEATHTGNAETLKSIEKNTAVVAQFFEQLETVTKLAAGKNQVPMGVFIAFLVIGGVYAIAVALKDSNMDVKIPWLGIEVSSKEGNGDKAER